MVIRAEVGCVMCFYRVICLPCWKGLLEKLERPLEILGIECEWANPGLKLFQCQLKRERLCGGKRLQFGCRDVTGDVREM